MHRGFSLRLRAGDHKAKMPGHFRGAEEVAPYSVMPDVMLQLCGAAQAGEGALLSRWARLFLVVELKLSIPLQELNLSAKVFAYNMIAMR